jgi:hypothetical protein
MNSVFVVFTPCTENGAYIIHGATSILEEAESYVKSMAASGRSCVISSIPLGLELTATRHNTQRVDGSLLSSQKAKSVSVGDTSPVDTESPFRIERVAKRKEKVDSERKQVFVAEGDHESSETEDESGESAKEEKEKKEEDKDEKEDRIERLLRETNIEEDEGAKRFLQEVEEELLEEMDVCGSDYEMQIDMEVDGESRKRKYEESEEQEEEEDNEEEDNEEEDNEEEDNEEEDNEEEDNEEEDNEEEDN